MVIFIMSRSYISEFSQAAATHQLTEHEYQQMSPMRKRPTLGSVVVFADYSPELALW
jgi:hypothetical protein